MTSPWLLLVDPAGEWDCEVEEEVEAVFLCAAACLGWKSFSKDARTSEVIAIEGTPSETTLWTWTPEILIQDKEPRARRRQVSSIRSKRVVGKVNG